MAPPNDDDTFDPTPTEILSGGDDAAFDPQATEQLAAPRPGQPGPKPFDASEGDTEAINVDHSDGTATGEGPTAPDLEGRPPARDDAATALIPGHALGLDGEPELDNLSSSKFLAGAPEAVADPFAGPVDELSSSGTPTPSSTTPGGPSPIVDDEAQQQPPHDPTGAWEGLPLAKPLEPTGETQAPGAKRRRSRAGCLALLTVLGLSAIGGGVAAWWFLLRTAEAPIVVEAPIEREAPPPPEPVEPSAPSGDAPAEPEAPVDDDEAVDDDEPDDEIDEDEPRRRRKKRKRRRARRKRPRGKQTQVATAPAAGQTTMSVGQFKDVSGAGISSLRATLARTLKRRLKGRRGVHLVRGRPSKGFVIDAWVQNVRKKKVDGGNMVEVSCSAALSEQPGGGVKFNTRATTGVGVSEKLTRSLIEELATDAVVRCAGEMANDISRYGARKAR